MKEDLSDKLNTLQGEVGKEHGQQEMRRLTEI
jgi:hypothetical protein